MRKEPRWPRQRAVFLVLAEAALRPVQGLSLNDYDHLERRIYPRASLTAEGGPLQEEDSAEDLSLHAIPRSQGRRTRPVQGKSVQQDWPDDKQRTYF